MKVRLYEPRFAEKIKLYQKQKEFNSKIYLAVNKHGMPAKFIVTDGTRANCNKAINLLNNIAAKLVFADRDHNIDILLKKYEINRFFKTQQT